MRAQLLRMVAGVSVLMASVATAGTGVLLAPESLAAADRTALAARIEQARQEHPQLFVQLQDLREQLPTMDARKRGRIVPLSPVLKAMGPDAVWPMLEALAFEATPRGTLSDSAWLAWRLGLIEAVGMTREPSARLVLAPALSLPELETSLVRNVAEALGRIGDDASLGALLDGAAREQGARQLALLSGLGNARRLRSAQALAAALGQETNPERAKVLVKALGDVGNAGAWRTPAVSQSGEGDAVRTVAARALVKAFVAFDDEVRGAASKALLVVDSPETANLIRAAEEGASPDVRAKLKEFLERFATNPARIRS